MLNLWQHDKFLIELQKNKHLKLLSSQHWRRSIWFLHICWCINIFNSGGMTIRVWTWTEWEHALKNIADATITWQLTQTAIQFVFGVVGSEPLFLFITRDMNTQCFEFNNVMPKIKRVRHSFIFFILWAARNLFILWEIHSHLH